MDSQDTLSNTVTATLTWQGFGPAPAVIVEEDADASWFIDGDGTGTCSCGLPNDTYIEYPQDAYDFATRYTFYPAPASGTTTITLPPVTTSGSTTLDGDYETDNFVNLSYSVTPNPVAISLTGATLVGFQQEALTGQQITATLNAPFQVDPTSYSWSVSGGMFKNFDWTLSSNQKTELTDADYFQSSFTFYDATRETLNLTGYATVICPDNTRLNVNAQQQIIILKPTETTWGVSTTQAPDGPFSWNYEPPNGTGAFDPRYGVQVTWSPIVITTPTPFTAGTASLVQIITSTNRVDSRTSPNGGTSNYVPLMPNPNGTGPMVQVTGGLDTGFPYAFAYQVDARGHVLTNANGGYSVLSPPQWSSAVNGGGGDRPSVECEPALVNGDTNDEWRSSTANDQFNTWTMYRPPAAAGQPTVWVPLQMLSWGWSGSASVATGANQTPLIDQNGNYTWNFTGPSISPSGSPSDTATFPEWTRTVPLGPAMGPQPTP